MATSGFSFPLPRAIEHLSPVLASRCVMRVPPAMVPRLSSSGFLSAFSPTIAEMAGQVRPHHTVFKNPSLISHILASRDHSLQFSHQNLLVHQCLLASPPLHSARPQTALSGSGP